MKNPSSKVLRRVCKNLSKKDPFNDFFGFSLEDEDFEYETNTYLYELRIFRLTNQNEYLKTVLLWREALEEMLLRIIQSPTHAVISNKTDLPEREGVGLSISLKDYTSNLLFILQTEPFEKDHRYVLLFKERIITELRSIISSERFERINLITLVNSLEKFGFTDKEILSIYTEIGFSAQQIINTFKNEIDKYTGYTKYTIEQSYQELKRIFTGER